MSDETCEKTLTSWHVFAAPILLIGAGIAAYWNSLGGDFIFDDGRFILVNESIRSLSPLGEVLAASKRPIVNLTFAINYALGEYNTWGYHAANLTIHILASITLFGVVRRAAMKIIADESSHLAGNLALASALIWLLHPLQTQSVTYIVQRGESLMGLFYLLTLYCSIRGIESRKGNAWFAGAFIACALGMGCKAVMVTAPIVVFLFDAAFMARSFSGAIRARGGLYFGLAASWSVLLLTGIAQGVLDPTTTNAHVGFGVQDVTPIHYLYTQAGVIVHYLKLSVWPVTLCLDYDWPIVEQLSNAARPGVIVLLLLGLSIAQWRQRRWLSFLGLSFFFILAPTSSVIPISDPIFEHRTYLPLAAVVVVFVILVHFVSKRLFGSSKRASTVATGFTAITVLAASITLGTMTSRRNDTYADDFTMWSDVVAKQPNNTRALSNLAANYISRGQHQQALEYLRRGNEIDARDADILGNLGKALMSLGRYEHATMAYLRYAELRPNDPRGPLNLGKAYLAWGDPDQAYNAFFSAVKLNPTLSEAHYELGGILMQRDDYPRAIQALSAAIRFQLDYVDAYYRLGVAYQENKQTGPAGASFMKALEWDPSHADAARALEELKTKSATPQP